MPNWQRKETIPGRATYRVEINGYANGHATRKRKYLIATNSAVEAERIARSRYGPSAQGFSIKTKKVADTARQSKD